jgi:sterol desaturase/sphingolipid hydroxylase (fatty acid hydroxylase superfamily)
VKGNYAGFLTWMDRLCGTYARLRQGSDDASRGVSGHLT